MIVMIARMMMMMVRMVMMMVRVVMMIVMVMMMMMMMTIVASKLGWFQNASAKSIKATAHVLHPQDLERVNYVHLFCSVFFVCRCKYKKESSSLEVLRG
jgi:hypothetical protein